jgi:hypothetical protein
VVGIAVGSTREKGLVTRDITTIIIILIIIIIIILMILSEPWGATYLQVLPFALTSSK